MSRTPTLHLTPLSQTIRGLLGQFCDIHTESGRANGPFLQAEVYAAAPDSSGPTPHDLVTVLEEMEATAAFNHAVHLIPNGLGLAPSVKTVEGTPVLVIELSPGRRSRQRTTPIVPTLQSAI